MQNILVIFVTSLRQIKTIFQDKMTRKHLKLANGNKKTEFVENVCNLCGKNYKHRSGLSRHKKKCELIFKKSVDFEDFQEKNNGNKKN